MNSSDLAILCSGKEIDVTQCNPDNLLISAIMLGRSSVAIDLLKKGANPNFEDSRGLSPLIYAILYNSPCALIEELLKRGANVNTVSNSGKRALAYADNADIRELLEKYGALE